MPNVDEHLIEIYKSLPRVRAFSDLMNNVKTLVEQGLEAKQAMSAGYAIAAYDPNLKEDVKESFRNLMRTDEVEEAQRYEEILKALEEDELTEGVESFSATYRVDAQSSKIFKPDVDPRNLPTEWNATIRSVHYLSGDKYECDKFKRGLKKGSFGFQGKGNTRDDAVQDLVDQLASKGLSGKIKVWDVDANKSFDVSLTPEVEPKKELVPVETNQDIRRISVNNGSEYLKALEELDMLTGRVQKLAESQRPAVRDVINAMEADLRKAVLVRLAETFRSLGYEEWPIDPEGQKDIENVMDSVSSELNDMGKRVNEMFKSEVTALRKSGAKTYKENLSRWLAGQTMIDEEPEKPEDDDELDEKKKKAKLSKEAQDFISAEIAKNIKDGMPQDQAAAAAYNAARDKGYEVPKKPKKSEGDEEEDISPDQPDPNEPEILTEPKGVMESKNKKSH